MSEGFDINEINMEGVEPAKDSSPIKAGPQHVRVAKVVPGVSPLKKTPFIELHLEYTNVDGLVPTVAGTTPRTSVRTKLYLSPAALPYSLKTLQAFGADIEGFKASRDINSFVGLEADVFVTLETNQDTGSQWNEVGRVIVHNSANV